MQHWGKPWFEAQTASQNKCRLARLFLRLSVCRFIHQAIRYPQLSHSTAQGAWMQAEQPGGTVFSLYCSPCPLQGLLNMIGPYSIGNLCLSILRILSRSIAHAFLEKTHPNIVPGQVLKPLAIAGPNGGPQ